MYCVLFQWMDIHISMPRIQNWRTICTVCMFSRFCCSKFNKNVRDIISVLSFISKTVLYLICCSVAYYSLHFFHHRSDKSVSVIENGFSHIDIIFDIRYTNANFKKKKMPFVFQHLFFFF